MTSHSRWVNLGLQWNNIENDYRNTAVLVENVVWPGRFAPSQWIWTTFKIGDAAAPPTVVTSYVQNLPTCKFGSMAPQQDCGTSRRNTSLQCEPSEWRFTQRCEPRTFDGSSIISLQMKTSSWT